MQDKTSGSGIFKDAPPNDDDTIIKFLFNLNRIADALTRQTELLEQMSKRKTIVRIGNDVDLERVL